MIQRVDIWETQPAANVDIGCGILVILDYHWRNLGHKVRDNRGKPTTKHFSLAAKAAIVCVQSLY